jgi:hypothetical protein
MARAIKPIVVFAGMMLLGIIAIYLTMGLAGGGHGSYLAAKLLFPYTMLLALPEGPIPVGAQAVAVLQFPADGVAVAANSAAGRASRVIAAIAVVHAVAFAAALALIPRDIFP